MGVLSGIDEAKKQISATETAFVGRLASVKLTMSTRSSPPTNYYQLEFEDKPKSLKGSVPTSNEFEYQQMGKGGQKINDDGSTEDMPVPKKPQSGQFYVAICNSNDNKIETLIEVNEDDLSSF